MFLKLFFLFTLIPLVEIYLLIKIGSIIGSIETIVIVIITGLLGAYLARLQGRITVYRVRTRLRQGIMPADDLLDGLFIFIAGLVLVTPGFITDTAGILLLIPASRLYFKRLLKHRFKKWTENHNIHFNTFGKT